MKLKTVGVICVQCGAETRSEKNWLFQQSGNWMGSMKAFMCIDCRIDHVLLYDHKKRLVMIFTEESTENFLASSGGPVFDDIPF